MKSRRSIFRSLESSLSRNKESIGDSGKQPSEAQRKHVGPPTRRPFASTPNPFSWASSFESPPAGFDALYTAPSPEIVRDTLAYGVDDTYSFLDKFHTEFLTGDSGSLAGGLWRQTVDALRTITPICTAHDADGVDIHLLHQPVERKSVRDSSAARELVEKARLHGGVPPGRYLSDGVKQCCQGSRPGAKSPMNLAYIVDGFPDYGARSKLAKGLNCFDGQQGQVEASTRQKNMFCYGDVWKDRWDPKWRVSQGYHRRNSWMPSRATVLLGTAFCWSMAAAHSIVSDSSPGNGTDPAGVSVLNVDPVQDTLSDFYRLATTLLPPTFVIFGLSVSAWVLLCNKEAYNRKTTVLPKHNFWGLMAFTASLTCWVVFATSGGPNNGKAVVFTAWAAFFSIYQSLNYRKFSHRNIHLFTSLLGGVIAASIVAGATVAPSQGNRGKAMAEQALIVSPTVLTVWSWLTANIQRSVENGQRIHNAGLSDPEHGAIELEDR